MSLKTAALVSVLILGITACSGTENRPVSPQSDKTDSEVENGSLDVDVPPTLADFVDGNWRTPAEKARDQWRHPVETLQYFGVKNSDTVIEIWPGGGWYTNILAPWIAAGDGQLIAAIRDIDGLEGERLVRSQKQIADYRAVYENNPQRFGTIAYTTFSDRSGPLGAANSVDAVLTFRNVHNWMGGDYAGKFFADAYAVLKPGGVLGVVEHRLPSTVDQDPRSPSGYVHEDYVKSLAIQAGFDVAGVSDINANPADTADHPFGVWTLQPVSRKTDRNNQAPDGFDPEVYKTIGESDRMTLKFIKPVTSGQDATP